MKEINEQLQYSIHARLALLLILSKMEYTNLYKPLDEFTFTVIKGWIVAKISIELFPYRDSQELQDLCSDNPECLMDLRENILSEPVMELYQTINDFIDNSREKNG